MEYAPKVHALHDCCRGAKGRGRLPEHEQIEDTDPTAKRYATVVPMAPGRMEAEMADSAEGF
jgi:hypothetical protein